MHLLKNTKQSINLHKFKLFQLTRSQSVWDARAGLATCGAAAAGAVGTRHAVVANRRAVYEVGLDFQGGVQHLLLVYVLRSGRRSSDQASLASTDVLHSNFAPEFFQFLYFRAFLSALIKFKLCIIVAS